MQSGEEAVERSESQCSLSVPDPSGLSPGTHVSRRNGKGTAKLLGRPRERRVSDGSRLAKHAVASVSKNDVVNM